MTFEVRFGEEGSVEEIKTVEIVRWSCGERRRRIDQVARESEAIIRLNGIDYNQIFCLSSHLKEMTIGNLISEGFDVSHLTNIKIERKNVFLIDITMNDVEKIKPKKIGSKMRITVRDVLKFAEELDKNSFLFKKTGGTHVVGVCNGDDSIFVEDISRHCAIDKIIGICARDKIDPSQNVLVASCRETASTMKKVINGRFPIVIGLSAPTDLAIKFADEFDVTLIGFASPERFNIYTHAWRVL
ncbi:MAG: formate dehydrogenase accessory protein [Candidatus Methanolliviera sp. GoM_oil]|nr:MAG: formate dehydrogenase accessory protein [Candidatus Methanolliviera sp. GoM_oil]